MAVLEQAAASRRQPRPQGASSLCARARACARCTRMRMRPLARMARGQGQAVAPVGPPSRLMQPGAGVRVARTGGVGDGDGDGGHARQLAWLG